MGTVQGSFEAVAGCIREAKTVAVVSHVNPDGDTLGSAAAMRLILEGMGKVVHLFCDGKVPDLMYFMPGHELFRVPAGGEGPFDLTLAVDVSDLKRMGACAALMERSAKTAQIDHHPTNPLFAEVNLVDGESPANCILIRKLMRVLGVPLTQDIAVCLYTGISTDTGNFSFGCTNAEAFRVTAELMEAGLPLAQLNRVLFRVKPREQMKLVGKALESMVFRGDGRIAVMKLTQADFRVCGALSEHADTVVNYALDTKHTDMAVLARETDSGQVKFSLRARDPFTVNETAMRFGGGGHPQASGITMDGTLDECTEKVLRDLEEEI